MLITSIPYFSDSWQYVNRLANEPGLIWFHEGSSNTAQEWLSANPEITATYWGDNKIDVIKKGQKEGIEEDFFDYLKSIQPANHHQDTTLFTGGLAGHISYDLGLELLNVNSKHPIEGLPLAEVGLYLWALNINHTEKNAFLCFHSDCPEATKYAVTNTFNSLNEHEDPLRSSQSNAHWSCNMTKAHYERSFNQLKDYIVEGDTYQVNLTRQWRSTKLDLSDLETYKRITQRMPAPFSMFHRGQQHSLLSVSPERFIQIKNKHIVTQPIKGTRARSDDKQIDESNKIELQNSLKDRAENLMIVDLLRNDLAKNATPGSVHVEKLFELQSFKNVHHLVSTVRAELKNNKHPFNVLRDAFPGGSITGTPKKRAMEIIDELETTRRGNYCGSGFYLNTNGQFDSNILIRSLTYKDGVLTCSGGGGIVHDSELESEYEESDVKVRRVLAALSELSD